MNKRQLIDEILKYNVTVQPTFLSQFGEADLEQYLEHLRNANVRNYRLNSWVRPRGGMRKAS